MDHGILLAIICGIILLILSIGLTIYIIVSSGSDDSNGDDGGNGGGNKKPPVNTTKPGAPRNVSFSYDTVNTREGFRYGPTRYDESRYNRTF